MHEYMSSPRVWGLMCPGSLEEVARARHWTRDILSGHPCADDAELGASALVHTASGGDAGTFHVTLSLSPQRVAVSVTDSGGHPDEPKATEADQDDTHGRGLSIVMTIACRLNITGNQHGRTVTAELHSPTPGAAAC